MAKKAKRKAPSHTASHPKQNSLSSVIIFGALAAFTMGLALAVVLMAKI